MKSLLDQHYTNLSKKHAFSTADLIITISLIGILATVMLSLNNFSNNNYKIALTKMQQTDSVLKSWGKAISKLNESGLGISAEIYDQKTLDNSLENLFNNLNKKNLEILEIKNKTANIYAEKVYNAKQIELNNGVKLSSKHLNKYCDTINGEGKACAIITLNIDAVKYGQKLNLREEYALFSDGIVSGDYVFNGYKKHQILFDQDNSEYYYTESDGKRYKIPEDLLSDDGEAYNVYEGTSFTKKCTDGNNGYITITKLATLIGGEILSEDTSKCCSKPRYYDEKTKTCTCPEFKLIQFQNNYIYDTNSPSCQNQCPDGTFTNNNLECNKCPEKNPHWNGKECIACNQITPIWNSTNLKCESCPSKTPYWNGSFCVNCDDKTQVWNVQTMKCETKSICNNEYNSNTQKRSSYPSCIISCKSCEEQGKVGYKLNSNTCICTKPQTKKCINYGYTKGNIPIKTAEDLAKIGYDPQYPLNGSYCLVNDIDLSQYSNWKPIGAEAEKPFKGNFYGNNFSIKNLKIYRPEENSKATGLFGYNYLGTINNLKLINVNIIGHNRVGGMVGDNVYGNLDNCYVQGTILGNSYVGGLAGINSGKISNSRTFGYITATNNSAGGLVGYNSSDFSNILFYQTYFKRMENMLGEINNCSSYADVIGSNEVGGLVGYNVNKGYILNSSSENNVSGKNYTGGLIGKNYANLSIIRKCHSSSEVSGENYVGGLVGYIVLGGVNGSYATGNVSGNNYVGGLVGWFASDASKDSITTSIYKCYATGNISGNDFIGGLIGNFNSASGKIEYSYSLGNIIGNNYVGGLVGQYSNANSNNISSENYSLANIITGNDYVGGLVGYSNTGNISNSYYAKGVIFGNNYIGGLINGVR